MKILIIINDVLIARNFISTSSFKQLEKRTKTYSLLLIMIVKKLLEKKGDFFINLITPNISSWHP